MKKQIVFLMAVLLIAVLLFFLKNGDSFWKEKEPEPTPTPEITEPQTLKNAWIISSEEDSITFFFDGTEQKLMTKGRLQETLSSCIADLTVQGKQIISLVLKPDKITGKVLRADATCIELEGYGELKFVDGWRLYRLYDGLSEEPSEKLLIGSQGNEFILENGRVCAALMKEKPDLETIRVLIGTEGFQGFYHDSVQVVSDSDYKIICGDNEMAVKAGEVYTFTKKSFSEEPGRKKIVTGDANGKITLCSIKRADGVPSYRGSIEVDCREDGLLVINELTIEEYLYAVIPSEMPSRFEKEALKAQAICARSYACRALLANRYAEYGAHVDDSVSSQVYNNIAESEESILAVKDTHGQVLMYNGEVAQCYYFSTSCGHTTSASDVWENAKEVPYLSGKLHSVSEKGSESPEVRIEGENADDAYLSSFLANEEIKTYDSESEWYRWQTFIGLDSLGETVLDALKQRYQAVPEQILTYEKGSNAFVSKPITELGEIESVRIYNRGNGGIATELLLIGSKGVILVKNEYNIRTVLAPGNMLIYRQNGEDVNGAALLPSAFIILQKGTYQDKTGYLVTGGGYGHGVGMSQCGADAMARYGYTCEEIMNEYYPGTTLGFIYGYTGERIYLP